MVRAYDVTLLYDLRKNLKTKTIWFVSADNPQQLFVLVQLRERSTINMMNITEGLEYRSVIYFYVRQADACNEPVTFLHRKKRATVTDCDVTPITEQK